MNRLKISHFEGGFSLVELILVVLIVGFTVLLINNLPTSIGLIGKSTFSSTAKDIASQSIENERIQTYDNLANGTNAVVDSRLDSIPMGSGTVTIIDCPGNICTNGEQIKEVTAQINWVESGNSKNVQMTTFISKGGLK